MARTPIVFKAPDPPPGLDLSLVPNIKGAAGAEAWVNEALGIPVTARYIAHQTDVRALECALIAGALPVLRVCAVDQRRGADQAGITAQFGGHQDSLDFYDYKAADRFTAPQRGVSHSIVGPYVDYSGTDYMVTLTTPAVVDGQFVGVAGADLQIADSSAGFDRSNGWGANRRPS